MEATLAIKRPKPKMPPAPSHQLLLFSFGRAGKTHNPQLFLKNGNRHRFTPPTHTPEAQHGGLWRSFSGHSPPPPPPEAARRPPGPAEPSVRGRSRRVCMGGALPLPPRLNKGKVAESPLRRGAPAGTQRRRRRLSERCRGPPQHPTPPHPAPSNRPEGGPFEGGHRGSLQPPPHSGATSQPPAPLPPPPPSGGCRSLPPPDGPLYLPPSSARASCHPARDTPTAASPAPLPAHWPPAAPRPAPPLAGARAPHRAPAFRPTLPPRCASSAVAYANSVERSLGANGAAGAPADAACVFTVAARRVLAELTSSA